MAFRAKQVILVFLMSVIILREAWTRFSRSVPSIKNFPGIAYKLCQFP